MAAEIFLIRHGETQWSLAGRHTGRTDVPLTENGERRVAHLRGLLQRTKFTHVLTSPLQRARRTCELVGFGAVARVEPDLQEWDYGDFEGRTTADIRTKQPGWHLFQNGCPRGESVEQISQRADRALAEFRAMDGTIILFSHGHFLRALAVRWIGLPIQKGQHLALDTSSVGILSFENPNREMPAISLWNAGSNAAFVLKDESATKIHPAGVAP